jgi:hypothetical protein
MVVLRREGGFGVGDLRDCIGECVVVVERRLELMFNLVS